MRGVWYSARNFAVIGGIFVSKVVHCDNEYAPAA